MSVFKMKSFRQQFGARDKCCEDEIEVTVGRITSLALSINCLFTNSICVHVYCVYLMFIKQLLNVYVC